ncbi:metal-sulfur cluster biosynthetic enzyme [Friedmanniella endophytica]|uniref:Metal-sulfur cluster biosynthetic enzyme n=1 Tax=Microlunatus kandeliicorticis TaxID=1759536 RepID=A0A7W3P5C5_9ACTN|nr:iron-sulfur cluster assembly protein [Microlunatus kandeliicorticis]MBA8793722.1 metal-sulfur cluster biosynthetic enzyme [Microlunatus kandeliicorticis]
MTAVLSEQRTDLRERVWDALHTVIDPELDEPVTDLGFVTECTVTVTGATRIRLRLPTAFCSPNFAYLMVSDAHDAVLALPGVTALTLTLGDHSDSDKINAGIAAHLGFADAFPAETTTELHELRAVFRRKAHQAFVERVCTALVREHGRSADDLPALRLEDLPPGRLRDGLLRRRTDLGLSVDPSDPVCVDEQGVRWPPEELPRRLRFARAVRVSIDGNAHFCRGLLATRYPGAETVQAERHHELLSLTPIPDHDRSAS